MQQYIDQLLEDIARATANIAWPYPKKSGASLGDWKSLEEENVTAPVRNLPQWTGIFPHMLPPASQLDEVQLQALLKGLINLLSACNCHLVFQTNVPEAIQYEVIRENFDQTVRVMEWNDGFFEVCKSGRVTTSCLMGSHCQCAFYDDLFKDFVEEDLSPEHERARALEIEILHIRKKYGDDWMKYYPYHLDKDYDDEDGNPCDYGFEDDGDDDDDDNWWRR
jgi:hypothetical protein